MRQLLLPLAVCLVTTAFAQKKVSIKKSSVRLDDQVIADFDGQGSMFKMVKLGVFAPGSKDTLIRVTEDNYIAGNPLFPQAQVVYRIDFPGTSQQGFYIQDAERPGTRVMEKKTMEMIFNDKMPVLISGGKLDDAAVQTYRVNFAYDFEGFLQNQKKVEDSIAVAAQAAIARDRSKPVTFKTVKNSGDAVYAEQVNEIYQDGVLLGKVEKKMTGGTFPKTSYSLWKKVEPVTIAGLSLMYVPIAVCETGMKSSGEFSVKMIIGKSEAAVKGTQTGLDAPIANLLVQQQIL